MPEGGYYREILNTDAGVYGGSNFGNDGGTWAHQGAWSDRSHHLALNLPPLGVVMLKRD